MNLIDRFFGAAGAESIRQAGSSPSSSTFRCVEIKAGPDASCTAVDALNGKRFLPNEIPDLPLPGCTAEACSCSYELFEDRRKHARPEDSAENSNAGVFHHGEPN